MTTSPFISRVFLFCILAVVLAGCQSTRKSDLDRYVSLPPKQTDSPYLLTLFVDARDLDYSSAEALYQSLRDQDYRRERDGVFGHAWIRLEGVKDGQPYLLEGGHTGETGEGQPKYWDGVMNYIQWGYCQPNKKQKENPRHESNPIKYLWTVQRNGYFEKGDGGHAPTHIAYIPLTEESFNQILAFITEGYYNFRDYSLVGNQCASFVVQVAELAGVSLRHLVTIPIEKRMRLIYQNIILWEDPYYSSMTISTPDRLVHNEMFIKITRSN